MKRFSQFLIEAKETKASEQAKKLGLQGDGHGDWYDSRGEFVAKTVGGELEFFNRGERVGKRDIPDGPKTKANQQVAGTQVNLPTQQIQSELPQQQQQSPEQQQNDEFSTIIFGRFNPPTIGHEKLFKTADRISLGGELKIYPSRIQDPKKNPLDPNTKISYMRKMFPKFGENIINNPDMQNIFDVLRATSEDGYGNVNIVVGSDRQAEIKNLANKYNGSEYNFSQINVVAAGTADSDKNASGMSASKMRKAAAENDFETFRRGVPKKLDDKETKKLFNDVRKGMEISIKENFNLWQIAPKLDNENLRENYVQNKIFKIGDIVENMNTGLTGKVIRRGTNYLICVTEDDIMFKSWIKDLNEYTEKNMNRMYREPGKPNTLTGTLGAAKYAAKQTPGAIKTGKENLQSGAKYYAIKEFINKYRKIKKSIYSNV
jgi:hypothetical protein